MSDALDRVLSTIGRAVAQVRLWFEPPLDADAWPLEIREAIIDRVEQEAAPASSGRRGLAHNWLTITVVAPDARARRALQAALMGVDDAIRSRLAEIRCPVPARFAVDVHFTRRPKRDWAEGQRFSVSFALRSASIASAAEEPAVPVLRVRVIRGRATRTSYTLTEPSVFVGRTAMPTDHRGQPRHNHVVFVEGSDGDAHGATVGRAHASIRYDADRREYRLFDDGSHNGTRILRSGVTIPVSPRDPAGVTVRSGDEIQFGTAGVRVEIGGDAAR
jgi:hypothetical protein